VKDEGNFVTVDTVPIAQTGLFTSAGSGKSEVLLKKKVKNKTRHPSAGTTPIAVETRNELLKQRREKSKTQGSEHAFTFLGLFVFSIFFVKLSRTKFLIVYQLSALTLNN
jgi:hypothetical protein